jgi:hypothetical protein
MMKILCRFMQFSEGIIQTSPRDIGEPFVITSKVTPTFGDAKCTFV